MFEQPLEVKIDKFWRKNSLLSFGLVLFGGLLWNYVGLVCACSSPFRDSVSFGMPFGLNEF